MLGITNTLFWVTLAGLADVQVFAVDVTATAEGFDGDTVNIPCTTQNQGTLEFFSGTVNILSKRTDGKVVIKETPYKDDISLMPNNHLQLTLRADRDAYGKSQNTFIRCRDTVTGIDENVEVILLVKITGVSIDQATNGRVDVAVGTSVTLSCSVVPNDPNPRPLFKVSVNGVQVKPEDFSRSHTFIPETSTKTITCTFSNKYSNGSILSLQEASASINGPAIQGSSTVRTTTKGSVIPTTTQKRTAAKQVPQLTTAAGSTSVTETSKDVNLAPGPTESPGNVGGAVGGGLAAVVIIIILIIAIIFLFRRRRLKREEDERRQIEDTSRPQNGLKRGMTYQGLAYANTEENPYDGLGTVNVASSPPANDTQPSDSDDDLPQYEEPDMPDVLKPADKHIGDKFVLTATSKDAPSFSTDQEMPDYLDLTAGEPDNNNGGDALPDYYNMSGPGKTATTSVTNQDESTGYYNMDPR